MNSKILIVIIIVLIIGIGGLGYAFWQNKNAPPAPSSSQSEETTSMKDAPYGHVHALFKIPVTGMILLGAHNGLFKSADQGKTFMKADTEGVDEEFMSFAYDVENNIIYAGGHGLGVLKSTDSGETWAKTDSGIKGDDIHALALNSLDPERIYAFSVDQGVFGTKDGAKSWHRIDDGPLNSSVRSFGYMATPSSMDRSMKTDTTTNIGYLWAGTGGGLYSSFACFCGWTKDQAFSEAATIYALTPDPLNHSVMLIGTKDGIFKTADEGKTFTKTQNDIKNVAAIAFDVSDQRRVIASTDDGVLYKSENGGDTWAKN